MKVRKLPLRKCIACNKQFDKRNLIRIVASKDGEISVDLTGKKNGRGAYLCKSSDCLKLLNEKKLLNKVFSKKINEKLYEEIGGIIDGNKSS